MLKQGENPDATFCVRAYCASVFKLLVPVASDVPHGQEPRYLPLRGEC